MKKFLSLVLVICIAVSCKKELVKEPERLIAKEKIIDIMYDLSLLEVMKYQNSDSLETNPTKFVLQKYKVDSVQFAQSNMYYASDYKNYKEIYDEVGKRLEKNKKEIESLIKTEQKKATQTKRKETALTIKKDSVKKPHRQISIDSLNKRVQLREK